ncbi:hypothetical protein CISIN_1g040809mg [Citrus sinensis]|uniref:Proteasome alpha-type subunits domain-containing protein n=1 Tax=Citrus sinensis TaxID=2711 RepID=A0A067GPB1_CITSI|nr:hypothetical protein CISIN_1g040809mg [Citrus sinensis]
MSRRYDRQTTVFSPEGRLYQVDYMGCLVGENNVTSKLLQTSTSAEKMYKIDDHVACAVAGIMSDANILINTARVQARRYAYAYQEPIQDYKDDMTRQEAVQLALKVLRKTMDSTSLTSEKLELAEVFLLPSGKVKYRICSPESLTMLLENFGVAQPASEVS